MEAKAKKARMLKILVGGVAVNHTTEDDAEEQALCEELLGEAAAEDDKLLDDPAADEQAIDEARVRANRLKEIAVLGEFKVYEVVPLDQAREGKVLSTMMVDTLEKSRFVARESPIGRATRSSVRPRHRRQRV